MTRATFAILGAGAMGTIVGAHLARAGHSVVMLVRERRARQIDADGLRLKGLSEFSVPVPTLTTPEQQASADFLIVTMKAIGTAAALEPLRNARIGAALSIQNGVMKNELLAAALPGAHILGALANFSGELLPSGEVLFTRNVDFTVGEPDGQMTDRVRMLASTLDSAGVRSTAVADIRTQEWSKFVAWVGLASVAVTTRAITWKFLTDPGAALVLARLIREAGALADAVGVKLTDKSMFPVETLCSTSEAKAVEMIRKIGHDYHQNAPTHRLSTLQDLEAHRPLELEETMGFAVEKARELRLNVPLLEAFYNIAKATRGPQSPGG